MYAQVLIKTRDNPFALLRSLQDRVRDVDAEQQITAGVRTLDGFIASQDYWARQRTITTLFSLFSVAAWLLAGVGFHSVLSCSVAQRSREFAVRMALGAQPKQIMSALFLSTASVTAVGLLGGAALYLFTIRIISHWSRINLGSPTMVLTVIPLVVLLAAVASYIPARRIFRIDPVESLRQG
jgi:ABC-type antimicrobial peptide transport system permease subunit